MPSYCFISGLTDSLPKISVIRIRSSRYLAGVRCTIRVQISHTFTPRRAEEVCIGNASRDVTHNQPALNKLGTDPVSIAGNYASVVLSVVVLVVFIDTNVVAVRMVR